MNIQDVVHNGRYKILELIGSGSQAVYKIQDLHDNNKM